MGESRFHCSRPVLKGKATRMVDGRSFDVVDRFAVSEFYFECQCALGRQKNRR